MLIVMPESFSEALVTLNRRERLSEYQSIREWQKAAMIAMMVENNGPGRPYDANRRQRYSIKSFSGLRIKGLRSPITIARYLTMWQGTGKPPPNPGEEVKIPVADPEEIKASFRR